MRFPLLHRKGLETPANTHQFNSVSWMNPLKTVLLRSSVLVLEADITQYRVWPIPPNINKPSSCKNRASYSLILQADSTSLAERTPSTTVCKIRSFCVLDKDFQLLLEWLDLAGKMRFPLLHRKGLETPANTHKFISVSWTHTLKAVLLGCSVLVLEADISPNRVYSHSL